MFGQAVSGVYAESFLFFIMIRMNNNKEFFEQNRSTFEKCLKEPLYALAPTWKRPCAPSTRPSTRARSGLLRASALHPLHKGQVPLPGSFVGGLAGSERRRAGRLHLRVLL
jgi:hypothetical protein